MSSYHDIEEETTRMQIFFEDPALADAAKACLGSALEIVGVSVPITVGDLPDEDWKLAYRRHFKTESVGRHLLIVPEWELASIDQPNNRTIVCLDPGMAFGTGKHETTRACLEYIDELSGKGSFLDMGCGSGILSIAALVLVTTIGKALLQVASHTMKESAAGNK